MKAPAVTAEVTAWSPLRNKDFATLWLAWLTANTCLTMCDVAAAWIMTTLSDRPVLVALVQTAATLPVLLLALPSGAMADLVDRRRAFFGTMLWLAAVASLLAVLAGADALSVGVLLALVFANGIGLALRWPVFAAIVPGVVARHELPQALALHGMAVNGSRVIGPLAAGFLLATVGSTFVFALSAVLSIGAALLVWRWRYAPVASALPGERFLGAMRVGVQYVVQSPALRVTMARSFVVFSQVTCLLALLPVVAKGMGGGDASAYTILFSCAGAGAMAMAVAMPWVRRRISAHTLVTSGTLLLAACAVNVALAPNVWLAAPAMIVVGVAWMGVGNTIAVSAQLALPDWVRARGMAIMLMAAMGGGAIGAALFGAVATAIGVRYSLLLLAALSVVALLGLRRWRLDDQPRDDLTPDHVPLPDMPQAIDADAGPVFVTIEYLIDAHDEAAFAAVMAESRRARLRGGALSWGLLRDAAQPRRHVEYFVDGSWVEHLRRVERLTIADAQLRERRLAFHQGAEPPQVTRYLGCTVSPAAHTVQRSSDVMRGP